MKKAMLFSLIALAVMPAFSQCNDAAIRQVMGPVCRQKANLDGYWGTRAAITRAESWIGEIADYGHHAAGATRAVAEHGSRDGHGRPVGHGDGGSMSRTQRAILGASLGANVAGIITGERKWMGVGAGGGALVGALFAGRDRDEYGRPRQVDCSKRKLNRREQEICSAAAAEQERRENAVQAEQERREAEAQAEAKHQAELEERQLKGGYLRNSSRRWNLEVTDCASADRPMTRVRAFVLRPGQRVSALGAICGYEGTFFVRSTSIAGVVDEQVAAFIISDDAGGWVFHLPEVRQKGGR